MSSKTLHDLCGDPRSADAGPRKQNDVVKRNEKARCSVKVKLVRDAVGGVQLVTENNEILQNVFVKEYQRIEGSVTRINMEVIFLAQDDKVKNW